MSKADHVTFDDMSAEEMRQRMLPPFFEKRRSSPVFEARILPQREINII